MSYYKNISLATQDILELLGKNTPKKRIYYVMLLRYGFLPEKVDKLILVVEKTLENERKKQK